MAYRKIASMTGANFAHSVAVHRDSNWDEYRVRNYFDGVPHESADYFCSDKQEALSVMEVTCKDYWTVHEKGYMVKQ